MFRNIIILLVAAAGQLEAQTTTLFDTLYSMDFDHIELELDLDSLIESKFTPMEHASTMKIIAGDEVLLDLPLKVSVRSKSRRRHCDFPPIKLNFIKGDLKSHGLAKDDEYKVVTHCLEKKVGEEVLIKEYMLYKLYSLITPISLRAKLFDIVYIDKKTGKQQQRKAVLLEGEKEFARAQGGKLCDCMGSVADSIDGLKFELLAMYQYMIGNDDMDPRVERNVKLIKPKDGSLRVPFAYDFDFSAIVNAPYVHTKVADNMRIKRKYLGFKENKQLLPEIKQIFDDKHAAIIDFLENFDLISKAERKRCIDYIESFYADLESNNLVFEYKDY
jgi:hypothetical protein